MRRRRLSLQEKIFLVRNYYFHSMDSTKVQHQFNEEYKVNSTEAIIKLIEKIIKKFESTGSVLADMYLENGMIYKGHEEVTLSDDLLNQWKVKEEIKEEEPTSIKDSEEISPIDQVLSEDPIDNEPLTTYSDNDDNYSLPSPDISLPESKLEVEKPPKRKYTKRRSSSTTPESTTLKCPDCGKVSKTKALHKQHLLIHVPPHLWRFPCTICGKPCATGDRRKMHEMTHISRWENDTSNLACQYCNKRFMYEIQLREHTKTHTKIKPIHICELCGKSNKGTVAHKLHMQGHTGEKPFACTQCPDTFKVKSSLVSHMRTHTGEKPFKCEICGKRFPHQSTLNVHNRQHTGENPYVCHICGKACKQPQNLRSHMRHNHKDLFVEENQRGLAKPLHYNV